MDTSAHQLDIHPLAASLSAEDRTFILSIQERHPLSFQQMRAVIEHAVDLSLWRSGPLNRYWREDIAPNLNGKKRTKALLDHLNEAVGLLRKAPTDYSDFPVVAHEVAKVSQVVRSGNIRLLGRCPCPVSGEQTRCCNLLTLDMVQQCAFACSYCSIQSFYHAQEIHFASDIRQRLEDLELPDDAWHIGTGQSSDSLMWGDAHGILDALAMFARTHPTTVVELKTKSARTDWIGNPRFSGNVVATWSVNAPTITEKEEHGTAPVFKRLEAAARAAQAGIPVGFHFHPMVWFAGWEDEYRMVAERISSLFDPDQVVMISLGTLTFTKEVLRQLRSSGRQSRILQMELTECAGKYSYPVEVKEKLFSHVYRSFPLSWRDDEGPFFYLCMELPQLWEPTLGRSYADNNAFEADMRNHYYRTLHIDPKVDKRAPSRDN